MNRIYKVIFNRSLGLYQVVSEIARNHGKSSSPTGRGRKSLLVPFVLSALLGLGLTGSALADDTETTVANAAVTMKDGDQMQMKGTGAASVSSSSTTDESGKTTTTITVAVPNDGKVENGNTGLVTGGTVYTAVNAALSNQIGTMNTDGNYIKKDGSVSTNLSTLDTQVKTNVDAINKEKTDREAAVTNVANTVGTLSDSAVKYDTDKGKVTLAGKGGTTITNVKDGVLSDSSTDAVTGKQLYAEQTARTGADTDLSNRIGTLDADGSYSYIKKGDSVSSNLSALDKQLYNEQTAREAEDKELSTKITSNTTDITGLKDLSNVSEAGKTVIKKQAKQAVKVAATGNATVSTTGSEDDDSTLIYTINVANNGAISVGDTNLVSGDTMYTELRPTGGTYVLAGNTTAANLLALDTNLVNVVNALGLDVNDTTKSYTSKLNKYFKVNPKITTSTDGTTYAPDAAANGTNAVAIGPSAQAGESTTDATTPTTTVTGGTSSTAIGDSAKANGNQAVALGYSASVLNPSSGTSTGSTAIGSNATVDSASNAMALGTKATINETATNGLAIGNGAVTGSAKTTATKADNTTVEVAAAGGVNSVAIGTGATNAGNTSIALGDGASVTNDTDGNYQAVVKSDDIAIGTSAKTSASDSSTAIGKSASVSQSTDAVAIGSSATASSSNDALVLGKEAKAASAADSIAMGTSAAANSADVVAIGSSTSATGANSVVIGKSAQTTSEGGNAIGSSSTASGRSTAIGQSATANNFDALAIGNGATANVDRSISLGYHAGVGTTEGKGDTQTSGSLIAIGTEAGNNVAGMQNIAIGSSAGSDTKSNYNVAIGSSAGYNISYSDDSKNQNGYNVSIGYKANYQDTAANIMNAISIGEKTNAENYAVAIGGEAQATGTNSIALGYKATAADTDSMALGYNSSAANGNIAIGVGSTAPKITMSTAYLTGDAAPSTYISVGTSDNLRRISNVADGSAAQDVVTVHQLTTAYTDLENTIKGIDTTSLNTYSTTAIDSKIADVKSQIANAKTKYFSYSTSTSTLAANADNTGATATAADAMAIGPNANATNTKTLAIGNNVYAKGLRSIAIGTADNPTTDSAGTTTTHNTSAEGENSIALGTSTTAQSDNSVAIGTRAQTYTTDTTKGSITGVKAVAIGYSATTAGDTSVAVGNNATVKYASGTAVGTDSLADGTNAVAIGEGSKAYSDNSTAIGQGNSITGNNAYGLGSSNTVSGAWGSVTTSGVSGYNNSVTSVSDANTMNAISGIYITGNSNSLTQNVVNNVVSDITAMGSSNTIDAGAGGTSSHPNTLSQIAIVGSGNTVQGKSSDDSKTNNIKDVTILGYNNKVDANTDTTVDFSNTQILGSNVTAKLGNSVYLGSNAAYTGQTLAASDAITSARTAADAAAEASDAYKAATTDAEKAQIKAQYEAQYLYKLNVQAMEASGTTAGTQSYSTDETFGDGTSYTYAGSSPVGVVTVGKAGSERRIQNVAAGLVSATSTDAVNGSQLYALTRQLRFGGDNSSFGTTTADDKNVVARGSNETIAITGGSDAVTASTTDGNTTYTVDTTKLTDNNIAVVADTNKEALHVQLASSLKNLNTAQLGSGSGDSYKETVKLDGTDTTNGGTLTLKDASGANGVTLRTSGTAKTADVTGTETSRLLVNDKTVATTDDGLKFGGDTGTDSALKLNNKLTVKGGATTGLSDNNNIGVVSDGKGTLTVKLNKNVNLGTDGSLTTGTVTATTVATGSSTLNTNGLTITGGPKFTSNGISANSQQIKSVLAGTDDTDAANYSQIKKATTTVVKGTNVDSVSDDTTSADGHHIYTVNVSNLGVKVADGQKTSVALSDGLVFGNGTNTTASVGQNGAITFNVSNDAIKTQAKDAINMSAGSNVKVDTATSTDGSSKTFTISATHNALKSATLTQKSNDVSTLTITGNDGDTASVDIKNTHLTVTKDSEAKTVTFTSNDGTTPATTLSLSDLGAASTADMNAAKAAASTEVKAGTNATLGTVETDQTDQHKIYTVNVDNLALKQNGTAAGTVTLADGINFADGTNTSATVSNGKVTFDLKKDITNIDTITASNSIQAGNVKVGKQGTDNKNYVTGLDNKNWTVGQTTYEAGRAATEDQLKSVSDKVASGFQVTDGTTSANIGADKKVTFTNGNYTTAKVTQTVDGASVQYDINTAQLNTGANGTITAPTTDGVATTQNVANAINSVAWNITAGGITNGTISKESIKAGDAVSLNAGDNMVISQNGKNFTYALSRELTGITSLTTSAKDGYTAAINGSGITIKPTDTTQAIISLTANGLNNGGKQITNVASGGTERTNAANIGDLQDAISNASTTATNTGFKVKGDDATAQTVKLGKQLNVVGGTNDANKLSDNNIGVVTTADDEGNATLTVKLNKDITLDSVKTGNTTLNTNGVSNGKMNLTGTGMTITDTDASKQVSVTTSGVSMGSQRIQNVADATQDTDAATLKQVKNARTKVAAGDNVKEVTSSEATDGSHQMTYTVNVDNLSVKANSEAAKSVTLKDGLIFNDGTNTTASVGEDGAVSYSLKPEISLTKVTTGSSTLDTNGLTISGGPKFTKNGIDAGSQKITGVAKGENDTDAVNKGQLDALQSQVSGGWNLSGTNSEGTAVTAQIGAGKTVTYSNGSYTKSVVTKDDTTGNATVKVDVTTGTFGLDAGKAASVTNGLATTQDVANAINSASISVVADDTPENKTAVKAGDTIHFAKDGNLTLVQNGTTFTYGLNPEINISKVTTSDTTKGSTVQTAEGVTTTDAAGNTYIQNGQGITLTPSDKTKSPVKLTNTGLDNGGNKITGVGKGTDDTDAVNVAQLKEVNDKVGSGWQLADNDGTKVADIGAGKKVSFKTDSQYLTAKTESAGTDAANVTYGLKTKALEVADGKVSSVDTAEDGLATAKNVADTINQTYWTAASGKSGSGSWTDETANDADKKISAGDTVTFNAGNNLSLAQNGASFTYGLQADLTGMNTITFTPRNDAEGHPISLVIGKQKDGVGTDEGYYITGLDNTTWNQSNYVKDRAATEAQLADAIKQVTLASQSGGFKLSDDNDKEVSQVLGKAIGVVGDGNITTTAETTTADPNGHIKVSLKKNIDLGTDGSLQAGGVTLKNNSVTVGNNGIVISSTDSEKTVSNLSNTTWDTAKVNQEASAGGYKGSTKAATESQLAEAISTATSTASANEQHIKDGSYSVTTIDNGDGTKSQGVSIDIITGDGSKPEAVKGHVVIKDVAKASDLGNVSDLHDTLKNADGKKNVTGALNNLDDRVTGLDNQMNNIYTTAGQHSSVSAEDNIKIDASSTNKSGGTDYKLSLNKEHIDLGNVTINGNAGSIKADSFTAGETVVNKDGVKIGDKSALTSDTLKVNGKTYVSGDGLNANSQKITNVAAGSADTDAVNVKQVNDLAARQGEAITENAAHIGELGRAVNKLDNRINRVGAGAAALAALHPGSYDPDDKLDVSAGVGNYRGANAAAVGLFFHPNERTILSVAGSMGGGENMVNAGVTLKVGPGHGTPTTVTTKTGEKVDVMDILAKQTEILEKLAGNAKAASAPAGSDIFPDVPQNHWAYAYVDKLYRTGSLAGFSEPGKLKSHMLTRKDFAEILYWAMTNGATTNPDLNSDGSLNRLAAEFGAELKLVMR